MNGVRASFGRPPYLHELLVLGVAIATYASALPGAFVTDDRALILLNRELRQSQEWFAWFFRDYYWNTIISNHSVYRPLTILSFVATFRLAGAEPWAFVLSNVALHAAVSLLVLILGRRLIGEPGALFGALLFAAHPLHTEAVAWIAGRGELLAATAALGACLLALRATSVDEPRPGRYVLGAAAAYAVAVFSKEHVVLLPGWVALVYLLDRPRRSFRRTAALVAGMGVVLVGFVLLHAMATRAGAGANLRLYNPAAEVPTAQRWLTAAAVIWRYLSLFVWPADLSHDYSYAQILPSSGLGGREGAGIAAILACLAAIAFTARRLPGLALALALVPVTFFVGSNIPFPIGTVMAERLTYLPTVGLTLAVGWALAVLGSSQSGRWPSWLTVGVVVALTALLALRATSRNADWQDPGALQTAALRVSPRSANVHTSLADLEIKHGNYARARAHAEEALRIYPRLPVAMLALATAHRAAGDHEAAIQLAQELVAIAPGSARMKLFLAECYGLAGQPQKAVVAYEELIAGDPGIPDLHYNLGRILSELGRHDEAEVRLREALRLRPGFALAHQALGALYLRTGRPARALDAYGEALRASPSDGVARYGMAVAALAVGDRQGALTHARQAAAGGVKVPEEFWRAVEAGAR